MGRYVLDKEDAVLILIDLQERLMPAISSCEAIRKNVRIMYKSAQILGIPIVLTEQYPSGLGTTLSEIRENIDNFHYVEKLSFSAFVPEFRDILDKIGRRTAIVAGVETHVCVFQTVRDLIKEGYNVHVVKDTVGSRTDENHKNGLRLMNEMGACISTAEIVLFDMLKTAASPHFKQISALVK